MGVREKFVSLTGPRVMQGMWLKGGDVEGTSVVKGERAKGRGGYERRNGGALGGGEERVRMS